MPYFEYRSGELFCEDVPLRQIATEVGTPVYVYSEQTLQDQVRAFEMAFQKAPHLICYAVKANSNIHLLRRFANWGTGFDIVSGGELFRVMQAEGNPQKVIFSGVGKTPEEIRYGLESDILFFNVESDGEIELVLDAARSCGKRARVSIRTNPDIDPRTHPYISTGTRQHKFGITFDEARQLYLRLQGIPEIEIVGVACHIGSQITAIEPFRDAIMSLRNFILSLKSNGVALKYLDFGGGLGISYAGEKTPSAGDYAATVIDSTKDLDMTLVLEPGRVIVGNAGLLLTRILLKKNQGSKRFVIVDAGMNDLIRPALYGSHHELIAVRRTNSREIADVVGPVCESADFLAKDREVPQLERGELLAVMSAGAYGFTLSSNYNSRRRAAEVLVHDGRYSVIRRRETYEDLIRSELQNSDL
jgi:diaminopimelate decarboxylase